MCTGILIHGEQTVGPMLTYVAIPLPSLQDKSFTFILKTPPASVLLKNAAGVKKAGVHTRPLYSST